MQFDLKPDELDLRILNCSNDLNITLPNVITVSPKELPKLTFPDNSFDLGLCSHHLFYDSEGLTEDFHLKALLELSRIASEIRVYPIVDKNGQPSPHLGPVLRALQQKGYGAELRQVPGAKEGHAMLRIWNESCDVKL